MLYISWILGLVALVGGGMLWYSKFLFGKQWAALQGFSTDAPKEGMGKLMTLSILMNIIISGAINFLVLQNNSSLLGGIQLAVFIWLCLLAPFHAQDVLFGKKPFKLFMIDSGYQLFGLLLVALISAQLVG
jgi:hypothetical protein